MQTDAGRPRVFVVDDEPVISTTLAIILQRSGFDAVPFADPLAALASIVETPPDMIVTDVMMPGMTGIDLALRVTKVCPDCKVLLFSGQAGTNDLLEKARIHGHQFEILAKPVPPEAFVKAIRARLSTREEGIQ